jgi:1,4-dihydroxy-2-naphthoate octaprenyltransferase
MPNTATHPQLSKVRIWIRAIRLFAFPATLVPVFVGAALAISYPGLVTWKLFPLVLICTLLFQIATNLLNDYFDFKKGIDRIDTLGSSGVLPQGLLEPGQLLIVGLILFGLGSLLGLGLVFVRGWPMLVLGLIGLAGGYFYTGWPVAYKYFGLGDIMVFVLLGPVMVIGSYFALTGSCNSAVVYTSLPFGLLASAIVASNNLRDIEHDRGAGIKTLAGILGRQGAKAEYMTLLIGAYLCVALMLSAKITPLWSVLVFVTVPIAIQNIRAVKDSRPGNAEALASIDVRMAQLHLVFSVAFIVALILGALV